MRQNCASLDGDTNYRSLGMGVHIYDSVRLVCTYFLMVKVAIVAVAMDIEGFP